MTSKESIQGGIVFVDGPVGDPAPKLVGRPFEINSMAPVSQTEQLTKAGSTKIFIPGLDLPLPAAAPFQLSNLVDDLVFNPPETVVSLPNTVHYNSYRSGLTGNSLVGMRVPRWGQTITVDADSYVGISSDRVYLGYETNRLGVTLYHDKAVEVYSEVFDLTPSPADIGFEIPPAFYALLPVDGVYSIYYTVENDTVPNPSRSPSQRITLDRTPPSVRVPDALLAPINPADGNPVAEPVVLPLDLLGNQNLLFPVPLAENADAGDTIIVYARGREIHREVMWETAPVVADDPKPGVSIPSAQLRGLGTGSWNIQYQLVDRAGNGSPLSLPREVTVQLDAVPVQPLPAPIITISPINREVARNGLPIRIDDIAGAQPADEVIVRLIRPIAANPPGDTGNEITLAAFRYGTSPRQVTVGGAELAVQRLFWQSNYELNVEYTLRRGGRDLGTSARATAPVDFRTAVPETPLGPIDPGVVDTRLVPVVVRGVTSRTDNVLPEADAAADAEIEFTYYPNPVLGQVVRFFWENDPAANPPVAPVPLSVMLVMNGGEAGTTTVTVPNAEWRARRNGQKRVYYEVYPDANPVNAGNYQRSPDTPVRVEAITFPVTSFVRYVAPGDLQLVSNRRIPVQNQRPGTRPNQTGFIGCAHSPWNGIDLEIADTTLAVGDFVTIRFGYAPTATAINATTGLSTVVEPQFTITLSVTQEEARQNIVKYTMLYNNIRFYVPGQEPTPNVPPVGGAFVSSFTVTKANGDIGRSQLCLMRFDRTRPAGPACDATNT